MLSLASDLALWRARNEMNLGFFHLDPVRFSASACGHIAIPSAHYVSGRLVVAAAPRFVGFGQCGRCCRYTPFTPREHPPTHW